MRQRIKNGLFGFILSSFGLIAIPSFAGDIASGPLANAPSKAALSTYRVIIGDAYGSGVGVAVTTQLPTVKQDKTRPVLVTDTGWVVTSTTLTNRCPSTGICRVQVQDAERNIYLIAHVAGIDAELGLALLQVDKPLRDVATMAPSTVRRNANVETCQFQVGQKQCLPSTVIGINGAVIHGKWVNEVVLTSATYGNGSDGTGTFAENGTLVGITVGTINGADTNNGATVVIPSLLVRKFVQKITKDYECRANNRPHC